VARILNIGSINLDEVFSVPHFIRPGETMASLSYNRFIGGKGTNQSIALARAGASVAHAGMVGADGGVAVDLIGGAGVDISLIGTSGQPTGRALIQVDRMGQNCIILYPGANRAISESDVDRFLDGYGEGDFLLLQNETSCLAYAMERASSRGLKVFFNPSPAEEAITSLPLGTLDCLILNEVEGAFLAGLEPAEAQDMGGGASMADLVLKALAKKFPRTNLVLTLGSAGVSYLGADGRALHHDAVDAEVVDTTAAGDTFTGYFIAAVMRGAGPELALHEASVAASICVSRQGASPSIPTRAELSPQL